MTTATILLLVAVLFFVLEAFDVRFGTLTPKWWALGVAAYLASLAA